VAECEHVTQGARQLNLTQSATSAAVAALEIKSGNLVAVKFPLLHRSFFALRHKERYVSRAEQALLDVISNDAASNRQKGKGIARSSRPPTIER
jgi:DNA-binding transcriptional LysR family regulator